MEIIDNKGRRYKAEVNIGTIAKAEKSLGVNLCRLLDSEEGIASLNDPLRVCEYIYHISDASEQGISFEDFGSGFAGDALGEAIKQFQIELTNFFHNPRRMMVKKVFDLFAEAQAKAVESLDAAALAPAAGNSPGNTAE